MRNKHEFKYRTRDTDYDPMHLMNKCAFITQGYATILPQEKGVIYRGMNFEEQAAQVRKFLFSAMMFRLETSCQVLDLTKT